MFTRTIEVGLRWMIVVLCSIALSMTFLPVQAMASGSDDAQVDSTVEEPTDDANEAAVNSGGDDEDGVLYAQAASQTINGGTLPMNTNVKRTLTNGDACRYSLKTTNNCALRVKGSANQAVTLQLYDSNGKRIAAQNYYYNDFLGEATYDKTYYLNTGSYYFTVKAGTFWSTTYNFTASIASTGVSFHETAYGNDNSTSSARSVNFDQTYKAQFSEDTYSTPRDQDYYKVTIKDTCEIMLSASTSNACGLSAEILNSSGKTVASFSGEYKSSTGKGSISGKSALLQPGTYYVKFSPYGYAAEGGGVYSFKLRMVHTMYRLYNPNSGEHFYTESAAERDAVKKAGWKYEGEGWTAPTSSKTPVYRLYSGTDHHYTTSAAERDSLKKSGWKYEGVGWYSDDSKTVPLYRQFNPNVNPKAKKNNSGSHNYTTSKDENNSLVKVGWKAEGIGWHGC